MARYLIKASYEPEGVRGLLAQGGSVRRSAVEKAVAEVGGSVESFYFAFGEDDVYVIVELPDNRAAATISLVTSGSGRVRTTVVPLLTVEDVDAIASSHKPAYFPPGD